METWFISATLLTLRMGIAFGMTPALSSFGLPSFVRVVVILTLSGVTAVGLTDREHASEAIALNSPSDMLAALSAEVVIGMMLALTVHTALATFAFAGRFLDVQIGFGVGAIYDPVSRSSTNVMGTLMGLIGLVMLYVTNAHLALITAVARSAELFPLGHWPVIQDPMRLLLTTSALFSWGLALTAPVILALLLSDLLVGIASRNLPQFNVLAFSIPVKILIASGLLSLSVRTWSSLIGQIFAPLGGLSGGTS